MHNHPPPHQKIGIQQLSFELFFAFSDLYMAPNQLLTAICVLLEK